ncbi:nitroreductase family deazaflavin-dependent oxidoreductase [Saccharomonospora xinjiangensis]|uniref:Deazaflavin-dependent nitroreductase family protein n=1 Tax=Saccharomonospora xinjiangensis XJ-54 TaxID=882086 RepID=I0V782_9PSEU|nr:nitroreductase family deazaflavin-dependent oxidoreductase [Saccharomonospora xinjiangensis]EID55985.1 deazaflavin-dependent nitroreductase family protein [Saccharomonospora xinjiangensis XJ-54]
MALPRTLARFNRVAANRALRLVAPWIPGLGVLNHVGRRSGRHYSTPVAVFRTGEPGYAITIVYGKESDWVRNVLAARHCELRTRGRTVRPRGARLVHDETCSAAPRALRRPMAALGLSDFVYLDETA